MSDKPVPDGFATLYAVMLPRCIKIAREHGYCFAIHGSLCADLDAVCVPWIEEASDEDILIKALSEATGTYWLLGDESERANPIKGYSIKPHNRHTYTLSFGASMYMDITVMPKIRKDARIQELEEAANRLLAQAATDCQRITELEKLSKQLRDALENTFGDGPVARCDKDDALEAYEKAVSK